MQLLAYLYAVATDPSIRPKSGLARSDFIVWLYGQTFLAILGGNKTRLVMRDCDAWTETPGVPIKLPSTFVGDTADLAERAILGDSDLALVLHPDPKARDQFTCFTTDLDTWDDDTMRLIKGRLRDISIERLLDPENVPVVRAVLEYWANNTPRPFSEFEIGSHRSGPRTTITI